MANSTISIAFTMTEDANGLKTLTMDADGLRKIMSENVKVAQKLQKKDVRLSRYNDGH